MGGVFVVEEVHAHIHGMHRVRRMSNRRGQEELGDLRSVGVRQVLVGAALHVRPTDLLAKLGQLLVPETHRAALALQGQRRERRVVRGLHACLQQGPRRATHVAGQELRLALRRKQHR